MHKIGYKSKSKLKGKRIYFIIMSNVFNSPNEIHERFDLKGSLFKRETFSFNASEAKKDLNFLQE